MLAQNRRLRHLQGVYLRNLTLTRPRDRPADDLEADLSKPPRLGALPEDVSALGSSSSGHAPPVLHHSQSSESLRPRPKTLRRRSTTLAGASPLTRQRQLESTVDSRAADVFFSLHCDGHTEPIYISELAERSVNTNFAFFDLSQAGPAVTRLPELKVKIWARRQGSWSLVLAQHVDLRTLNYLDSLRNRHFPPNCLVFHLADGMYCLDLSSKRQNPKQQPPLPTSSYNALMKLSNLENSIQDALATREKLTAQINAILQDTPLDPVPEAQESAALASKYVMAQGRAVTAAQLRREQLRDSIRTRREAMAEGKNAQATADADVKHAEAKLAPSLTSLGAIRESIHGQRHRICEDLSRIFVITPDTSTSTPLSFRICDLPLPNTDYDPTSSSATEDSLSAALGYVAQLVNALQFYLSVPLPYPIQPYGSRSSIRDDISVIPDTQRDFPLFLRGGATAQYRFDYAWFLLNKDIETLCASAGLKVVDIRHTLPNLKYLLYVCSAGTDEVPERKRGGVRGLWAGRIKGRLTTTGGGGSLSSLAGIVTDDPGSSIDGGSTNPSRRGSIDSDLGGSIAARQAEQLRQAVIGASHKASGGNNNNNNHHRHTQSLDSTSNTLSIKKNTALSVSPVSSSTSTSPPVFDIPFSDGATMTLRTKGLRENVGA
ncbi:UV radiation resistance protein and autophagy-related subunit 14-domain-containing protein [Microdochium bolleyi]|uniref:Autophagy-related protein 14 n=1 Tax=Microdochium bolleyi TaxID=196109 RepID=A0A136JG86_9PEZI|nr:UV radiation resistance protein and autophagy-related subunit 14-domain-containing protein [Microdochium bolleyi]